MAAGCLSGGYLYLTSSRLIDDRSLARTSSRTVQSVLVSRCITTAAAVAIALSIWTAAPAAADADHVRYEIESNGPISLVTYFDGIGDIKQDSPPGWATYWREFTNVATFPFYSVSAQTEGTSVTCRLFVDGTLQDTNTTYGRFTIADCSYSP
jgi:hypothetical protein